MNVPRGFLSLVAVLGMLLGIQPLFDRGTALAQPETEEISTTNDLIDCSTNPAYDNQYIASAFRAGGGHAGGRNQQCNACHRGNSPRPNTGDTPVAKMATALVHNRLDQPFTYAVKYGKKGTWETVELKPGAVVRHTYKYSKPGQNRSPEFWVKYQDPTKGEVERPLTLVATPNPRLGSVYFVDRDTKNQQVKLWVPTKKVSRPPRR